VARRLVAADASPLIGLAAAGAFHLLRELFGTVTVTQAVRDEVLAGDDLPGAAELAGAISAGWIVIAPAPEDPATFPELSPGEASTLDLALEYAGESLVLIDERLGRARARALGLNVVGLAGILLASKKANLIDAVVPLLARLEEHQFRLSREVVEEILREAGEP
jgi:predicted nucleic acid-binding protein